ncbi:MAG TPA: endonuclease domain-containing protein [Bacteroidales bacterium]
MKATTIQYSMYYGASPDIFRKAKELRKKETDAEKILWNRINNNQILGLNFRRQHPVNQFIVDFYCHGIKLVIEVDGGIHDLPDNKVYDLARSEILEKFGLRVIRFRNDDIIQSIDQVIQTIIKFAQKLLDEAPKSPVPGDLGGK